MSNETVKNLVEVLGGEKSLMILRGQVISVEKIAKQNSKDVFYYTFALKVVESSESSYQTGYSLFYCILPSDIAINYLDFETYKHKEVAVLLKPNNRLKTVTKEKKDDFPGAPVEKVIYKFNNSDFYVIDLLLLGDIAKVEFHKPMYNL